MKTKITLLILLLLLPLWSIYSQTVTAVATPSTCAANGKIEITATEVVETQQYRKKTQQELDAEANQKYEQNKK